RTNYVRMPKLCCLPMATSHFAERYPFGKLLRQSWQRLQAVTTPAIIANNRHSRTGSKQRPIRMDVTQTGEAQPSVERLLRPIRRKPPGRLLDPSLRRPRQRKDNASTADPLRRTVQTKTMHHHHL